MQCHAFKRCDPGNLLAWAIRHTPTLQFAKMEQPVSTDMDRLVTWHNGEKREAVRASPTVVQYSAVSNLRLRRVIQTLRIGNPGWLRSQRPCVVWLRRTRLSCGRGLPG